MLSTVWTVSSVPSLSKSPLNTIERRQNIAGNRLNERGMRWVSDKRISTWPRNGRAWRDMPRRGAGGKLANLAENCGSKRVAAS